VSITLIFTLRFMTKFFLQTSSILLFIFLLPTPGYARPRAFLGSLTNTTFNIPGQLQVAFSKFPSGSSGIVTGYANASGLPLGSVLCGAGNFRGKKRGSKITFSLTSNDRDPGCFFDKGLVFKVTASLNRATKRRAALLRGRYLVSNGQRGKFSLSEQ
jgi:hypothetical protein